jgi:hypothetical protein
MRATPATGDVLLRRYQLGPLVGLGGTARVFRAWDHDGGGTVAVKVFPPGSAAATRGGNCEGEVLSGIRHIGLVAVRDCGTDRDGCPFVVMDFVEGESLSARLRRGPLPAESVVDLGAVLAAALAHVHARGIVHRDVKPGNVLLDEAGRPRLTDFGIARFVDATRVTATGVVQGTAAYMAPEQVRGETVGPAADVYALGLVLLEALTGRREYDGGALESALARLNRIPHVPSEVPDPLGAALRRMTLTEPTDRPRAAEVAAMLGEPRAPVGLVLKPGWRALARRLGPVGALAVLAAAVVGGAVLLGGGDAERHTGGDAHLEVRPTPVAPAVTGAPSGLVPPAPSVVAPAAQAEAPAPLSSSVSSPGPPVHVVAAQTILEETRGNRTENNNGSSGKDAQKGKSKGKDDRKGEDNGKSNGKGKSKGKSKGKG